MTTRIILRNDLKAAYEGTPEASLNQGEIVLAVSPETNSIMAKLGTEDQQAFSDSVKLGATNLGQGGYPLTVGSETNVPDGAVIQYDGSLWLSDARSIEFSADSPSGVLTYTASTDTWSTDTASFVPSSLDGGTFTGSFVAPAFAAGYAPTIGDA